MLENAATQLVLVGSLGVIPTDTLYGVVARASDRAAVERLYALKHREHKPGTIIAAGLGQLQAMGFKPRYFKPIAQYWPGPVSVVLPISDITMTYLHQGKRSLAVRIPDDEELQQLLITTGPLLTSSANPPGEPPATTIEEAKAYFGESVDFYVDGGDLSGRKPSTVIRVLDDAVEVLRQGAMHINDDGTMKQ
jgi:L-threonylcarbamoyladenylate synthase